MDCAQGPLPSEQQPSLICHVFRIDHASDRHCLDANAHVGECVFCRTEPQAIEVPFPLRPHHVPESATTFVPKHFASGLEGEEKSRARAKRACPPCRSSGLALASRSGSIWPICLGVLLSGKPTQNASQPHHWAWRDADAWRTCPIRQAAQRSRCTERTLPALEPDDRLAHGESPCSHIHTFRATRVGVTSTGSGKQSFGPHGGFGLEHGPDARASWVAMRWVAVCNRAILEGKSFAFDRSSTVISSVSCYPFFAMSKAS